MDLDARLSDIAALRRVALIGVALAILIGSVSTIAAVAAFGWDFEATIFGDPKAILGRGPESALLFRWAFLGDMFYSCLLLAPLALFLHRSLRERRPWLADVGLMSALAYIVLGGELLGREGGRCREHRLQLLDEGIDGGDALAERERDRLGYHE